MPAIPSFRAPPSARFLALRPRLDLRTGLPAAVKVRCGEGDVAETIDTLSAARTLWRAHGHTAPLAIALPLHRDDDAAQLDAAARAASFHPHEVIWEADELALIGQNGPGLKAVEQLRARGWALALRCEARCPLPLGTRARALFTELIVERPPGADMTEALIAWDEGPMAIRLGAAQACGLMLTLEGLKREADLRLALSLGFDRAEAPPARIATL
jgi:hypothetical protein